MSEKTRFTFTVLRYVHDIVTGEFANVGIVLHAPDRNFLRARVRSTHGRISRFFPGMDGETFRRLLAHVETAISRASDELDDLFVESGVSAIDYALRILPHDDSSLQWSPLGSGLTRDPAKELELLFDQMVLRYDRNTSAGSRTDEQVWHNFSYSLQKRNLMTHLREKEISADADVVTFQHAWKNGAWNCLAPLSFDLVDGDSIKAKAYRCLGQMTALKESTEPFKVYLLVGEPAHSEVYRYYQRALRILDEIPVSKAVFTESQAEQLSSVVEQDIAQHDRDR